MRSVVFPSLVYIAGGIKGVPDARERFEHAAQSIIRAGHKPLNPFDVKPWDHVGPCPTTYASGESGHDAGCHLRADIAELLKCDAIYMLLGWEKSRGASAELFVAQTIGIHIEFQQKGFGYQG